MSADRTLYDPRVSDIVAALNETASVRELHVVGNVLFDQVLDLSGRRNVHIDFSRSFLTKSAAVSSALIDDATNCLVKCGYTLRTTVMDTTFAVNPSEGAYRVTVTNAGTIKAGDFFLVTGPPGSMIALVECAAAVQAVYKVESVAGNVLTLGSPFKYTMNRLGDSAGGNVFGVTRVVAIAVAENITLVGGRWDCTGNNVAVGVLLQGSRNVKLHDMSARGFGRAFINGQFGAENIVVADYMALGSRNTDVFMESCHAVTIRSPDFLSDAPMFHPIGTPRASMAMQRMCTDYRIEGGRVGNHALGIRAFGGRNVTAYCGVVDTDARRWTSESRTSGDDALIANYGSAFASGAAQVGAPNYLDEFGRDYDLRLNCRNNKCANADAPAVYIHDVMGVSIANTRIMSYREAADGDYDGDGAVDHYNGIMVTDCFDTVNLDTVEMRGITGYGICLGQSAGSNSFHCKNYKFSALAAGTTSVTAKAILIGVASNYFRGTWSGIEMGNGANLFHIAGSATALWQHVFRDVRWADAGMWYSAERVVLAKLTSGVEPANGCLLECDPATPDQERWLSATITTNTLAGKWIKFGAVSSDLGTWIAVCPANMQTGMVRVRAADAVVFGSRLDHDGTTGKFKVNAAATTGFISVGVKAAGVDGMVPVEKLVP